jgi:hypothetical protein
MGLAASASACGNVGRNGFFEMIPRRQFNILIEEHAHDSLLVAVQEFAASSRFNIVKETYRSAQSAPAIFWILERVEGMIVFQNKVVGEESDPLREQSRLYRYSRTEFSAMFYRSIVGYTDEQIEELIAALDQKLATIEGLLEFADSFPRDR